MARMDLLAFSEMFGCMQGALATGMSDMDDNQ